jgi:hypothetical protein
VELLSFFFKFHLLHRVVYVLPDLDAQHLLDFFDEVVADLSLEVELVEVEEED